MSVLPRPPYPLVPPTDGLTPMRLWVLFRALCFDREQTALLTGTTVEDVTEALTFHGIVRSNPLHPKLQDIEILWDLARRLGVAPSEKDLNSERKNFSTEFFRRHLREAVASGNVPWAKIDALPPIFELGR